MLLSTDTLRFFSLAEGGPLYRMGRWAGIASGDRGLIQLGLVLAAIAWVPLFALSLFPGGTEDATVSFAWSLGTHTRFLVTVPLFFMAEVYFSRRSREALEHITGSRLIAPSDTRSFADILATAMRWRDSVFVEAALVAVAIGLILSGVRGDLPAGVSHWRTVPGLTNGRLTPAGWWYAVVSLPLFQFLTWRWCWRLLIWWIVLWRLSRLDLRLTPTHPDRSGGLGGLGVAHTDLMPLTFGVSAMLVASYAEDILFASVKLESLVLPLTGIVLGMTALVLAPLVFFVPRLLTVKQRGLLDYGRLAAAYTADFDRKWLHGDTQPREPLLGTADVQSLADLANSFEVIRSMRLIPVGLYQVVLIAGAAAVPMLPLLLTVFPLDELILRSVKSLTGI
jgi:hypothetical protein